MGEIIISTAKMEDAEELNRIECAAFPSAEAASLESYKYRITNINDWFLKAEEDGKIVGLICCRPVAIEGVTDDTRSAPLITKVPLSVIRGKSPMNTSVSLISPVSLFFRRTNTFSGAA